MPRYSSLQPWLSHHERDWDLQASCRERRDLPWTGDHLPEDSILAEMRGICMMCPVQRKCAAEAFYYLKNRGVIGGFYAGAWIPWPAASESGDNRKLRSRARQLMQRRSMSGLTIYTAPGPEPCNGCEATMKWLNTRKPPIPFTEIVATEEIRDQLRNEGYLSFPVVKTADGQQWSGFRIDKLKLLISG